MTIIHANLLDWAKTYTGPKFHALLCDPPYHLTERPRVAAGGFGGERSDDDRVLRKGFMGRDWDGGDVAFQPSTWAALAEHLYPGAWGMAFASSRGWHRLACAIEGLVGVPITSLKNISDLLGLAIETRRWDLVELAKQQVDGYLRLTGALVEAGMIIQPTIFGWSYGSGFPKATNIAAGIDARAFRAWLDLHPVEHDRLKAVRALERAARRAGDTSAVKDLRAEIKALSVAYKAQAGLAGKVLGTKKQTGAKFKLAQELIDNGGYNDRNRDTFDIMGAATEAASYWLGHRYGGQVLKPALEPIIVFQKPYAGSALDCITRTGAGALWVDGGRIGNNKDVPASPRNMQDRIYGAYGAQDGTESGHNPNIGRWPANLILSHAPTCNGVCAPGCPVAALGAQSGERPGAVSNSGGATFSGGERIDKDTLPGFDDTGTAARFFFQADYMAERLELADAIAYVAKASRSEREAGLDPRQTALMRLLDDDDGEAFDETTVDDGRTTPIDNPYQRGETTRRNTHPTIKPIALSRYLATLLLPPAQYGPRRLLIPFSGAGSEVIGADLAGWEQVTGIELEADHVAIANARRAYWRQRRWELDDPARKLTIKASAKVPQGQADMFESEVA